MWFFSRLVDLVKTNIHFKKLLLNELLHECMDYITILKII